MHRLSILVLASIFLLGATPSTGISLPKTQRAAVKVFPSLGTEWTCPNDAVRSPWINVPANQGGEFFVKVDLDDADYINPTTEIFLTIEVLVGEQIVRDAFVRFVGVNRLGKDGKPDLTPPGFYIIGARYAGKTARVCMASRTSIRIGITLQTIEL